MQQTVAVNRRD